MVNIAKVMAKYMHMSQSAIDCAFGHGQVFLDGRCLGNNERVMVYDDVRGQILTCAGRTVTMGNRPAPPPQLTLG